MPEGVNVLVEDGEATIEFVDQSLRGQGLGKLLEAAGDPQKVQKVTRPVQAYIVSEDVARQAGFLDGDAPAPQSGSQTYDDGLPDMDWKRDAIDEYATKLDPPQDTTGEANKRDAIDAINTAVKNGAKRPEAPAPA